MTEGLSRRRLVWLLVVVVIGWGVGQLIQHARPIGRDVGATETVRAVLRDTTSPAAGSPGATLTLVVFTDYQCPACRAADPAMTAAVARDGHVRVSYRDWPIFGAVSERAARVAIAAARQGIYPALHQRLMAERRPLDDAVLRDAVEAAGGDWAKVTDALRIDGGSIDAQFARTRRDVVALGIAGTPGYLAGSILVVGALDEAGFARLFARGRTSMKFE